MSLENSNIEIKQQINEQEYKKGLNPKLNKNKPLFLLEKIENFIVAVLLFLILITIIAQVYARFITGDSITWAGELARFIAVWLVFFGTAIALRRNMHIQVDNLYHVVSNKLGLILYILRNLIIIAFLIVIFMGSLDMLEIVSLQTSPGLGLQMNFVYIVLPVSICLMVIILLLQTLTRFRKKRG